jgi:hypothetical protein
MDQFNSIKIRVLIKFQTIKVLFGGGPRTCLLPNVEKKMKFLNELDKVFGSSGLIAYK